MDGKRELPPLVYRDLGTVNYPSALQLQNKLRDARLSGESPDLLLLLEHPPTYTRGRRSDAAELPMDVDWYGARGVKIHETDRGGRVTYHGPGQLVAYPILDLRTLRNDVVAYIRLLEDAVVAALAEAGVTADTIDGQTGVWAGNRKIASIGVHVSRGITTHGVAINFDNDLTPFEWIVPCGIEGCRTTSVAMESEYGSRLTMREFKSIFANHFATQFERELLANEALVGATL